MSRALTGRPWRTLLPLIALAVLLGADVAYACPVCFQAKNDASRLAFLVTTLFMTLLPLGLFGGVAYWVKRRSAALDGEVGADFTRPEGSASSPAGSEPAVPPAGRPTPVR